MLDNPSSQPHSEVATGPWQNQRSGAVLSQVGETVVYLKQVYSLLAASLILATAAGYVGMSLPFAHEHPFILIFMELGALLLALAIKNTATLFLFTGISGLTLGPIIAHYVGAGLSGVVGEAVFLTGMVFSATTVYALTTKRDFSWMGGMLFAGLIVLLIGGLINLFFNATIATFAISAMGTLIFTGYILYETQELRNNPWAVPPAVAALSMYLNVLNLFVNLLQLLGILSGGDD